MLHIPTIYDDVFLFFLKLIYNVLGKKNLTTMQLILLEKKQKRWPCFWRSHVNACEIFSFFPALKTVGTLLLSTLYVSTNNKRQFCAYDSFFKFAVQNIYQKGASFYFQY